MSAYTLTPTLSRKREKGYFPSRRCIRTLRHFPQPEARALLPLPLAGEGWGEGATGAQP